MLLNIYQTMGIEFIKNDLSKIVQVHFGEGRFSDNFLKCYKSSFR